MHTLIHLLEHAFFDCLKMLPFLFLAYLFIEYVESSHSARLQRLLTGHGRWGFAAGGLLGLVPQCGFSAMAANLYAGRVITPGTLLAVFLATSDEALPLLIAGGDWGTLVRLAAAKLVLALVCGFAGLVCSYAWDTTVGAAIVLWAAACYFISLGLRRFIR